MNALPPAERQALELVDIIEFKWLMAGAGVRVHVERLQADPEYARACLARAAESPEAAVREANKASDCLLNLPESGAREALLELCVQSVHRSS